MFICYIPALLFIFSLQIPIIMKYNSIYTSHNTFLCIYLTLPIHFHLHNFLQSIDLLKYVKLKFHFLFPL
jgi:hypothetical protein